MLSNYLQCLKDILDKHGIKELWSLSTWRCVKETGVCLSAYASQEALNEIEQYIDPYVGDRICRCIPMDEYSEKMASKVYDGERFYSVQNPMKTLDYKNTLMHLKRMLTVKPLESIEAICNLYDTGILLMSLKHGHEYLDKTNIIKKYLHWKHLAYLRNTLCHDSWDYLKCLRIVSTCIQDKVIYKCCEDLGIDELFDLLHTHGYAVEELYKAFLGKVLHVINTMWKWIDAY